MDADLRNLPLDERIRLVEDLWDSIAADQDSIVLTAEQREELDRRLGAYRATGEPGRLAEGAVEDIRQRL